MNELPQDEGEQFRLLVASAQDIAIFTTDAEGTIATWNPGVLSVLGYGQAEFVGRDCADIFTPEEREQGAPDQERETAAREGRAEDERWHVKKDGSRFWGSGVMVALRDEAGALRGYSKILRDFTERHRYQERLRATERELRMVVDGAKDYAIFGLDPSGHIATWNDGAERIKQYRAEEIIGQHLRILYLPEDREAGRAEHNLRLAAENGVQEETGRRMRKDGSVFEAEVVIRAIRDERTGALLGFAKVVRDVTERVRREQELKAANERAYEILESIEDAFYALDADFRFTYVNRKTEQWWGRDRHALVGRHYWTEFPKAVGSETYERHLGVMRERRPVRYETVSPVIGKWIDISIFPTSDGGLSVYFRDISERKAAESALQRAYDKEHRVADTLQKSLLLAPSLESLRGVEVVPAYEPALAEAMVGGDFYDAFPVDGSKVVLAVGDASGKGLLAAVRTAEVKFALRAFLREYPYPASALGRVNAFLCEGQRLDPQERESFVTLALALIDVSTGEVTFAVAGAEPPLLLRGASGAAEPVEMSGLPLGIDPEAEYGVVTARLTPRDRLLLATDGITEARAPAGEGGDPRRRPLLGYEGMVRMVQEAARTDCPLVALRDAVVEGARAFGGGTFNDDVCLLLARLK